MDHRVHFLAVDILNLFLVDLAELSTEANRSPFGTIPRQVPLHAPLLHGSGYGRTEPDPCSGLCDENVLWAPPLQHSVQHTDGDGHFGRLSPVRLRSEPPTDDALPARVSAFTRARQPYPDARCWPMRPSSAMQHRCRSRRISAISAASLGIAFACGDTITAVAGWWVASSA